MKKNKISISYNAPVTLTFAIICFFVLLFNQYLLKGHPFFLFTAPASIKSSDMAFDWKKVSDYVRLFTYIFGHADWNHLLGNLSFILLLGPLMEERYGSKMILLMFSVTAFVTGVINVCLIPKLLMGASGIVFMLIILSSITTIDKGKIPLTFIFVVFLYIGREIYNAPHSIADNISTIAHVAGGLCGSLFGFMVAPKGRKSKKAAANVESFEMPKKKPLFGFGGQKKSDYDSPKSSDNDETIIGSIDI